MRKLAKIVGLVVLRATPSRDREAATLARLKTEQAKLRMEGRQIENEAAPIRYVAELVGVDNSCSEKAIRWL